VTGGVGCDDHFGCAKITESGLIDCFRLARLQCYYDSLFSGLDRKELVTYVCIQMSYDTL